MTVGELKSMLEKIDNDVVIINSETSIEYVEISLFLGTDGETYLELDY